MVNIYVMDKEFQTVGVIDVYESLLWTDRFYTYGDFELYTAFDPKILNENLLSNALMHVSDIYNLDLDIS